MFAANSFVSVGQLNSSVWFVGIDGGEEYRGADSLLLLACPVGCAELCSLVEPLCGQLGPRRRPLRCRPLARSAMVWVSAPASLPSKVAAQLITSELGRVSEPFHCSAARFGSLGALGRAELAREWPPLAAREPAHINCLHAEFANARLAEERRAGCAERVAASCEWL